MNFDLQSVLSESRSNFKFDEEMSRADIPNALCAIFNREMLREARNGLRVIYSRFFATITIISLWDSSSVPVSDGKNFTSSKPHSASNEWYCASV